MFEWAQQRVLQTNPLVLLTGAGAALGTCFLAISGSPLAVVFFAAPAFGAWRLRVAWERERVHRQEIVDGLLQLLRLAHEPTYRHALRTAELGERVAHRLGVSRERTNMLKQAIVLHDIGKMGTDERILDKPGPLDESEYSHVKEHAGAGADILDAAPCLRKLGGWVRAHHERMDGLGYPAGLSAADAPLESRIIAVVDAFDAMVSEDTGAGRGYRRPKTTEEALEELRRCAGTQFDPRVVEAFCEAVSA